MSGNPTLCVINLSAPEVPDLGTAEEPAHLAHPLLPLLVLWLPKTTSFIVYKDLRALAQPPIRDTIDAVFRGQGVEMGLLRIILVVLRQYRGIAVQH